MPKIFISYRRDDSQYQADRLHQSLKKHVANPKRDIFIDVDNIPVGVDFVEHLDHQVAQCDVLLAVIGPTWLNSGGGLLGGRRLDDPKDFVRIEIASALKRGIPVAPILLDGVAMPREDQLPADLKPLVRRNAVEIRRASFDADTERMIRGLALKQAGPRAASASASPKSSIGAGRIALVLAIVLLALGGGAAAYFMYDPSGRTGAVNDQSSNSSPAGPAALPSTSVQETGASFRDCSDCPEMVTIPAGSFMMGAPANEPGRSNDEGPQRLVKIGYQFAAGKFEVSWAEWGRCLADGACPAVKDDGFGKGTRPVTNVSWDDAHAYTRWLSGKAGKTYRLLSESEWEYAARGGSTAAYPWGESASHQFANYGQDACCDGLASGLDRWVNTSPAGSFDANAFGLRDMHGNVWEWVEDCGSPYSAGPPSDGSAFTKGSCSTRVNRGGAWSSFPRFLRSSSRSWDAPDGRGDVLGFRVARTLP